MVGIIPVDTEHERLIELEKHIDHELIRVETERRAQKRHDRIARMIDERRAQKVCDGWCDSPASESSPRGFCDNCEEWWWRMISVTDELDREEIQDIRDNHKYGTYFIKCDEFIKIGKASDIHERLRNLQTANPYKLELLKWIADTNIESETHHKFRHLKVGNGGKDWYKLTPELLDFIGEL